MSARRRRSAPGSASTRDAIEAARLAAGSVGIVPVAPADAAAGLVGQPATAIDADVLREMGIALADAAAPVTDSNGADDYKHALVVELAGRAVREAAAKRGIERRTRC